MSGRLPPLEQRPAEVGETAAVTGLLDQGEADVGSPGREIASIVSTWRAASNGSAPPPPRRWIGVRMVGSAHSGRAGILAGSASSGSAASNSAIAGLGGRTVPRGGPRHGVAVAPGGQRRQRLLGLAAGRTGLAQRRGISARAAASGWRASQASAVARTDFSRASHSAISTAISGLGEREQHRSDLGGVLRALSTTRGRVTSSNSADHRPDPLGGALHVGRPPPLDERPGQFLRPAREQGDLLATSRCRSLRPSAMFGGDLLPAPAVAVVVPARRAGLPGVPLTRRPHQRRFVGADQVIHHYRLAYRPPTRPRRADQHLGQGLGRDGGGAGRGGHDGGDPLARRRHSVPPAPRR